MVSVWVRVLGEGGNVLEEVTLELDAPVRVAGATIALQLLGVDLGDDGPPGAGRPFSKAGGKHR